MTDEGRVTAALRDLDERLDAAGFEGVMDIQVVGGYALQLHGVRSNLDEATDIDYYGEALPLHYATLIEAVGVTHGLERLWFNIYVMSPDGDPIGDMEIAIGKLRFAPSASLNDLRHFRVQIADVDTLLRMKLIAIDTQAIADIDRWDLARPRDLDDVALIASTTSIDVMKVIAEMGDDGLLLEPAAVRDRVRATLAPSAARRG